MVTSITPRQIVARMAKGGPVQFVDARAEQSWSGAAEQAPGAVRVRLATLTRDATRVARNCEVVVYGADDAEPDAARIAEQLRVLGFGPVRLLAGGFAAWREHRGAVQPREAAA